MAAIVNLQDIVDHISMISDLTKSFVDRETGVVFSVDSEGLGIAEEGEEEDVDEKALAIVKDWDRYEEVPGKRGGKRLGDQEGILRERQSPKRRDRLLRAISGSG